MDELLADVASKGVTYSKVVDVLGTLGEANLPGIASETLDYATMQAQTDLILSVLEFAEAFSAWSSLEQSIERMEAGDEAA
ncbi:hypothetical protein [Nocardioides sp. NPDC006273]|uniref:hypothetical protein n=1 Tax=Nocardioides sp. NPDC006273 TaxID=3155598 RepID=UPI0033BF51F0